MVFRFSTSPHKGIRRRGKIVISRAAYKFCPVGWRGRKYRRDQSRSGSRWINGLTYAVAELRVRRTASSGLNSVESISPRRKRQSSPGIPVFVHFPACLQLGFVSFRVVPSLSMFSPRSRLFPLRFRLVRGSIVRAIFTVQRRRTATRWSAKFADKLRQLSSKRGRPRPRCRPQPQRSW